MSDRTSQKSKRSTDHHASDHGPSLSAKSSSQKMNPTAVSMRKPAIQAKLEVNTPGDSFEQEADAVADTVMRSSASASPPMEDSVAQIQRAPEDEQVQRAPEDQDTVQRTPEDEQVQRAPEDQDTVQRADDDESIQRSGEGKPSVSSRAASTIRNPGTGSPLPNNVRSRIEPHVGANLSGVRVHNDARAGRAASDLRARAFTHGNHIFLSGRESSSNVRLMAHEATHVVQQGAAVRRMPQVMPLGDDMIQRWPDAVGERLNGYARYIPGWTLFTVIIEYNPLLGRTVPRTPMNLIQGCMELIPLGPLIFDSLREHGVLQAAFDWVTGELRRLNLSLGRLERTIEAAWDEMSILEGISGNLEILERHFGALYRDVVAFANSLIDRLIELITEAAIGVVEGLLADNAAWALIKKVLHRDPLRDVPIEATTVEILEDFLRLIGKEQELEQMRVRGTLQETADWIDTQIGTFLSLLTELRGLFTAAWDAIQPANLPNLRENLTGLVARAGTFLQRLWDFASTVAIKVLELIKNALLDWLKTFARDVPGYHLLTVILGRDVFTQERVPRTPINLIRGFMSLIPGGEQQFQQMSETGVIPAAAARIEAVMDQLNISWEMAVNLFLDLWNSLSINDLIDPIGAFQRIVARFGEPISRLFAFVIEVIKVMLELVLVMMNFPTELIGSIIANAMQAFDDIKRDPVGFLLNLLRAVKVGFTRFFDNFLTHLVNGLVDWLFGQLRGAGIEPPADLSLSSLLDFALGVLGITMENMWSKLAERIGQENVDRIRGAIDTLTGIWTFIQDVQQRGVAAIWEHIESQISNLWNTILDQVTNFVMERIVNRVVARLLSMLDPTGVMAVVNSFMVFFNAVQSAIEYLREMLEIVNDFVTTVAAVARGDVNPGAERMEQGLAAAMPVAIGFLANQVGLGRIGDQIVRVIQGIREMIDSAINWLLDRAVRMGQSILRALGVGGGEEAGEASSVGEIEDANLSKPLDLSGESHVVYAATSGGVLTISMASGRRLIISLGLGNAITEVESSNLPEKSQILTILRAALELVDSADIYQDWNNLRTGERSRYRDWPSYLDYRLNEIVAQLSLLSRYEIQSLTDMNQQLLRGDGEYQHLPDPPDIRAGAPFSSTQRTVILQANSQKNQGVIKSDLSGVTLDDSLPSTADLKPEIDHIYPKSRGGSNSYSNARVLSRAENQGKGAITPPGATFGPRPSQSPTSPRVIIRRRKEEA